MKLVVGLGNPGEKYYRTRHNLGFAILDEYARKVLGSEIFWTREDKFKAETLKVGEVLLVKPQTFMNNSGLSVSILANYFKVPLDEIIVIHDELDLPLGKIKVRTGGSAAGHHGVESIIASLGDDKFVRIRAGIAPSSGLAKLGEHKVRSFNAEHFVLETFLPSESSKVKQLLKRGVEALELLLESSVEEAQNQFN
ncbi:MAG: aminoacyl-tRNA hydrolase [bacterium]|nr:aminoacyl-tRNA hydrolase [bacterium]